MVLPAVLCAILLLCHPYGVTLSKILSCLLSLTDTLGMWTFHGGTDQAFSGDPSVDFPQDLYDAFQCQDEFQNFWLFGGSLYSTEKLNALWKFDVLLKTWIWVSGTNETQSPGYKGSPGASSTLYYPSGRSLGAMWYSQGHLYFFGGTILF